MHAQRFEDRFSSTTTTSIASPASLILPSVRVHSSLTNEHISLRIKTLTMEKDADGFYTGPSPPAPAPAAVPAGAPHSVYFVD